MLIDFGAEKCGTDMRKIQVYKLGGLNSKEAAQSFHSLSFSALIFFLFHFLIVAHSLQAHLLLDDC